MISKLVLYVILIGINILPNQVFPLVVVVISLLCMVIGRRNIVYKYLKISWPLLFVLIIGVVGLGDHEIRDIQRDLAYSLYPLALLYIGHWLAWTKKSLNLVANPMIHVGLFLAIIHLSTFALNPSLITAGITEINAESYVSGDLVTLALIFLLFGKFLKFELISTRLFIKYFASLILLSSFILSYSRTGYGTFIILSFAILGYLHRINLRIIIFGIMGVIAIIFIGDLYQDEQNISLISKISRSLTEIKINNYDDFDSISLNWRGFETFLAVKEYLNGNILQIIFGRGFGALVPLGFTMNLAGSDYDHIPVLHNGYAYILIKTGLIGLVLYLIFFIKLLKIAFKLIGNKDSLNNYYGRFLLGLVICLILTMYVVGGPAELHGGEFLLLVGYLTRWLLSGAGTARQLI